MIWQILTPGYYLVARTEGTKKQAEKWAKDHFSVYKIEKDTEFKIKK